MMLPPGLIIAAYNPDAVRHTPTLRVRPLRMTRKLTRDEVVDMRARRVAGETLSSIANAFGLHPSTTERVVSGRAYRHFR